MTTQTHVYDMRVYNILCICAYVFVSVFVLVCMCDCADVRICMRILYTID